MAEREKNTKMENKITYLLYLDGKKENQENDNQKILDFLKEKKFEENLEKLPNGGYKLTFQNAEERAAFYQANEQALRKDYKAKLHLHKDEKLMPIHVNNIPNTTQQEELLQICKEEGIDVLKYYMSKNEYPRSNWANVWVARNIAIQSILAKDKRVYCGYSILNIEKQLPRPPYCHKCKKIGHWTNECQIEHPTKADEETCHTCGKPGHKKAQCEVTEQEAKVCSHCRTTGHAMNECESLKNEKKKWKYDNKHANKHEEKKREKYESNKKEKKTNNKDPQYDKTIEQLQKTVNELTDIINENVKETEKNKKKLANIEEKQETMVKTIQEGQQKIIEQMIAQMNNLMKDQMTKVTALLQAKPKKLEPASPTRKAAKTSPHGQRQTRSGTQ